jgi:hypothetical protein
VTDFVPHTNARGTKSLTVTDYLPTLKIIGR